MEPGVTFPEISERSVPSVQVRSEPLAQDCLSANLFPHFPAEDSLEAMSLVEARYRQHLAQRELQTLFEDGSLQFLGS